ncbi:hypothetical protein P4S72_12410 [Vibrio sp. PP-XX7]
MATLPLRQAFLDTKTHDYWQPLPAHSMTVVHYQTTGNASSGWDYSAARR